MKEEEGVEDVDVVAGVGEWEGLQVKNNTCADVSQLQITIGVLWRQ